MRLWQFVVKIFCRSESTFFFFFTSNSKQNNIVVIFSTVFSICFRFVKFSSVAWPWGLQQPHGSFTAWAGYLARHKVTNSVVCVRNVGHTDGLRPLVSAVAVMFNSTIFCDVTVHAKCIHHLRESEHSLQSHFARSEHVQFAQSFILQWLLYKCHASGVKQWSISPQELFKGLCDLVMEVLRVSLVVQQMFKIMFR